MTIQSKFNAVVAIAALLLSTACSTPQTDTAVKSSKGVSLAQSAASASIETVKPGAAISLSHNAPEAMTSGQFMPVSLFFQENYEGGDMRVELTASEGLRFFGDQTQKNFVMDGKSSHDWPIDVRAAEDGIYFISVLAVATGEDTNISGQRSFSIRLDFGNITPEMRAKAFPENGTLSADGTLRILEAQETIQ